MERIKILLLSVAMLLNIQLHAQEKKYVINGTMTCDSLRFSNQTVKKLYLSHNVDGETIVIDSATVENKKFTFTGHTPKTLDIYEIIGFDNGCVQLFLEDGNIEIPPFDARFPVSARVIGTENNNVLSSFLDVNEKAITDGKERMNKIMSKQQSENAQNDQKTTQELLGSVFYSNNLYTKVAIIDLVNKNIDKPATLYLIKNLIYPMFTPKVIERQYLRAVPEELHNHPMYRELTNQIRAAELKVGNKAPDIVGYTPEGKELYLSDLKGKYILLDFWASWCAPCRREFPFVKEILSYSEKNDKFAVLSYSIDSKEKDWKNCIVNNELTHKNWIHISTLKGWNSEAARLFNVEGVPYTVLINPKGEVVAFELRGEAMVEKIKNIIDGKEIYE